MLKLPLNRRQVVKNIGVVELQIVQNGGARTVVDEFAAFVEEGGVVLVGLYDKAFASTQLSGHTKIQRNAAHQKAGLEPARLQNPRQHRGRRCFSMRASDGQYVAALQHVFCKPLRAAGVAQARVQNRLHQGEFRRAIGQTGTADDIADHENIRLKC